MSRSYPHHFLIVAGMTASAYLAGSCTASGDTNVAPSTLVSSISNMV
ncbi:hypothetical protein A7982_13999 [Minicystis rosea]|nr:hypothetical protein A7982_13999 [Minicystis rosea]